MTVPVSLSIQRTDASCKLTLQLQVIHQRLLLLSSNPHLLPRGASRWCSHSVVVVVVLIRVVHIRLALKRRGGHAVLKGGFCFAASHQIDLQLISKLIERQHCFTRWLGIRRAGGLEDDVRARSSRRREVNKRLTQRAAWQIGRSQRHFERHSANCQPHRCHRHDSLIYCWLLDKSVFKSA